MLVYTYDKNRIFNGTKKVAGIRPGQSTPVPPPTPLPGSWFWTGQEWLAHVAPDKVSHRTRVTLGELTVLFGVQAYAKLYRAAYPQGGASGDDTALFFFERAKNPTAADGMIEVTDAVVAGALDFFIAQNYLTPEDKERIQQGLVIV